MPETKHDIPLSQKASDSDTLKKSNGSSMKPASKSRLFSSSEALYKEIYYSRRIKKILDRANNPDEYATLQKKAKKKVKSRLRLMMAYNWVFLVAIVFAVIGFSRGWFKPNTIIESRDMSFLVFDSNFPAYLSASFNGVSLFDYKDEEYVLSKTILPGDVINLSVFMDFTGIVSIETVEVSVLDIPYWLDYIKQSSDTNYAKITEETLENGGKIINLVTYSGINASPEPEKITYEKTFDLKFLIDLPEDYKDYDGVCLDFKLFFEDNLENQNDYMNQTVKLRFKALKVQ